MVEKWQVDKDISNIYMVPSRIKGINDSNVHRVGYFAHVQLLCIKEGWLEQKPEAD